MKKTLTGNKKSRLTFEELLWFIEYLQKEPRATKTMIDEFGFDWKDRRYLQCWIRQAKRLYFCVDPSKYERRWATESLKLHVFKHIPRDLLELKRGDDVDLKGFVEKNLKTSKRSTVELITHDAVKMYYFEETPLRKIIKIVNKSHNYEVIGGVVYLKGA